MQNNNTLSDPNKIIQQGMSALQQGKPEEARNLFVGLINAGIENVSLWLAIAYASRDLGDLPEVLRAVDNSLRLESRNPRAYLLKGYYFEQIGDSRSATVNYQLGIDLAPPAHQMPPDLKPELERAKERYEFILKEFEENFYSEITKDIDIDAPELRRIKYSLDFLSGKKQPYMQEPKNFYFPELPNIEFADLKDFDWVDAIEAEFVTIKEELLSIVKEDKGFKPYLLGDDRVPQTDAEGLKDSDDWSAFYIWQDGEIVEENAARCPKTFKFFEENIPMPFAKGRWPNVLISKLCANTRIPPHNGLYNTRYICHLPLIIPEGCGFRVGHDVREWEEGKVWVFDDSVEHEAWNDGDEDRYILLFETWHPQLSEVERDMVSKILATANSLD